MHMLLFYLCIGAALVGRHHPPPYTFITYMHNIQHTRLTLNWLGYTHTLISALHVMLFFFVRSFALYIFLLLFIFFVFAFIRRILCVALVCTPLFWQIGTGAQYSCIALHGQQHTLGNIHRVAGWKILQSCFGNHLVKLPHIWLGTTHNKNQNTVFIIFIFCKRMKQ